MLGCGENYSPTVQNEDAAPGNVAAESDSPSAAPQQPAKPRPPEPKDVVRLTRPAMEKVLELRKSSGARYLRVGVRGNAQMGLSYDLRLDDWADPENDFIGRSEGVRIVVSKRSSLFLEGTTIDWRVGEAGEGFVFDNPNAVPAEQAK